MSFYPACSRKGIMDMNAKPAWLRKRFIADENQEVVEGILRELRLNTVCREARCPNYQECFASRTATFMILGTHCTRDCAFCNVSCGPPQPVDPLEPARVGEAVARLGLRYVVITSVTRDDLADGGSGQFAKVTEEIRARSPGTAVELLIPDFQGNREALEGVIAAGPAVVSHNMETVRALYSQVRPQADYGRSLALIRDIKRIGPETRSKSGVMAGLGESREEMLALFDDLRDAGCEFLTVGQYLAPTKQHLAVKEYVHPALFQEYAEIAREKGFAFVASAPFVRSSYHAGEALASLGNSPASAG
jgi:lipoic acid synthetase